MKEWKKQTGNSDRILLRANIIIAVLSVLIAVLVTGIVTVRLKLWTERKTQEHLAEEVLRFHVLANSDSEEDQAVKMKVKEIVIDFLEEELPEDVDGAGTKQWIRSHIDEIEALCRDTLSKETETLPVSAAVTTCWFPEKTYGDVTFPQGNYEALRIELGEAKGQNWWCVLYPNLCFLDATTGVVPGEGKQKLKQVLTEDEYAQVTTGDTFRISWFFTKILDKE